MSDIKYCLSFDCADKTLGICLIGFLSKKSILDRIEKGDIKNTIDDILSIKQFWLFNLLPEAKVRETDDHTRLSKLKSAILSVKSTIEEMNIKINEVHIEYQMGPNDLSRLIYAAIIYEFCSPDDNIQTIIGPAKSSSDESTAIDIFTIFPSAKNSICFHPSLAYGVFAAKYKTNTTANKHHTAENFKYFLKINECSEKNINQTQMKHAEINHIADAFMQSVYKISTTYWVD